MLRRAKTFLCGSAVVSVALLAGPGAAHAATQWTMDQKVTVRNAAGDYVLGYAFGNDAGPNTPRSNHFNEQARDGRWI